MTNILLTDDRDHGFTLIELLIAIVVVGILSAVAIVGIGGLTNSGQNATCQASLDAARTASAVHFANTKAYPADFAAMVPAELTLASGVTNAVATAITNGTWTITIAGGGTAPNTFTSSTPATCA